MFLKKRRLAVLYGLVQQKTPEKIEAALQEATKKWDAAKAERKALIDDVLEREREKGTSMVAELEISIARKEAQIKQGVMDPNMRQKLLEDKSELASLTKKQYTWIKQPIINSEKWKKKS